MKCLPQRPPSKAEEENGSFPSPDSPPLTSPLISSPQKKKKKILERIVCSSSRCSSPRRRRGPQGWWEDVDSEDSEGSEHYKQHDPSNLNEKEEKVPYPSRQREVDEAIESVLVVNLSKPYALLSNKIMDSIQEEAEPQIETILPSWKMQPNYDTDEELAVVPLEEMLLDNTNAATLEKQGQDEKYSKKDLSSSTVDETEPSEPHEKSSRIHESSIKTALPSVDPIPQHNAQRIGIAPLGTRERWQYSGKHHNDETKHSDGDCDVAALLARMQRLDALIKTHDKNEEQRHKTQNDNRHVPATISAEMNGSRNVSVRSSPNTSSSSAVPCFSSLVQSHEIKQGKYSLEEEKKEAEHDLPSNLSPRSLFWRTHPGAVFHSYRQSNLQKPGASPVRRNLSSSPDKQPHSSIMSLKPKEDQEVKRKVTTHSVPMSPDRTPVRRNLNSSPDKRPHSTSVSLEPKEGQEVKGKASTRSVPITPDRSNTTDFVPKLIDPRVVKRELLSGSNLDKPSHPSRLRPPKDSVPYHAYVDPSAIRKALLSDNKLKVDQLTLLQQPRDSHRKRHREPHPYPAPVFPAFNEEETNGGVHEPAEDMQLSSGVSQSTSLLVVPTFYRDELNPLADGLSDSSSTPSWVNFASFEKGHLRWKEGINQTQSISSVPCKQVSDP